MRKSWESSDATGVPGGRALELLSAVSPFREGSLWDQREEGHGFTSLERSWIHKRLWVWGVQSGH